VKAETADPAVLENDLIRLELGPDGRVVSLIDKRTGRELVDSSSKHGFGHLLQATKTESCRVPYTEPAITIGLNHPLAASLIIEDAECPLRRTEIIVRADEPVVRFRHAFDLRRAPHRSYEDGSIRYDIAYPLDVPDGRLTFDTPAGMLDPGRDYMPAAHHLVLTHHGGDISGSGCGVAFASQQAPMWEFGGINGLWGTPIPPESAELMVRLLSKLDEDMYREGIGPVVREPGAPDVRFYETALMLHDGSDPSAARRFLLEEANPLIAVPIKANPDGMLPDAGQLLDIDGEDIALLTLKKAEDGDGYILRLMETAGSESAVTIAPGLLTIAGPEFVDNIERPICLLAFDGQLRLTLRPREIVTIRFRSGMEVFPCC
jgi:alpha-mannosidase